MTTDGRVPYRQVEIPVGGIPFADLPPGGGSVTSAVARYALAADKIVTLATNTDVPDLTGTLNSDSTTDVFLIHVTLDVSGSSTAALVAEVVVAAVAQPNQIVVQRGTAARHPATQLVRVTGLAAGAHTFKVRARLTTASGSYTITNTHSVVIVTHLTGLAAITALDGGAPDSTYLDFIDGGTP